MKHVYWFIFSQFSQFLLSDRCCFQRFSIIVGDKRRVSEMPIVASFFNIIFKHLPLEMRNYGHLTWELSLTFEFSIGNLYGCPKQSCKIYFLIKLIFSYLPGSKRCRTSEAALLPTSYVLLVLGGFIIFSSTKVWVHRGREVGYFASRLLPRKMSWTLPTPFR